jgi:hypothetical protein
MIAGLERALDLIVDRPLSCEPIRAEIERIRRGE